MQGPVCIRLIGEFAFVKGTHLLRKGFLKPVLNAFGRLSGPGSLLTGGKELLLQERPCFGVGREVASVSQEILL